LLLCEWKLTQLPSCRKDLKNRSILREAIASNQNDKKKLEKALDLAEGQAAALEKQGRNAEAADIRADSVSLVRAIHGNESRHTAKALYELAVTNYGNRLYDHAMEAIRQAAAIYQQNDLQYISLLGNIYLTIGNVLYAQERPDDALTSYLECVRILEHVYGPNHPSTIPSYINIGLVYCQAGRYADAIWVYRRAKLLSESILGDERDKQNTAEILHNMGVAHEQLGEYENARSAYKRCLEVREKLFGEKSLEIIPTLNNLAQSCMKAKEVPEAVQYLNRLKKIVEKGTELEADILWNLSQCYLQQRKMKAALQAMHGSYNALAQCKGWNHEDAKPIRAAIDKLEKRIDDFSRKQL